MDNSVRQDEERKSGTQAQHQLEELQDRGVLQWSDDESIEAHDDALQVPSQAPQPTVTINEHELRETRIGFLQRMTLYEAEDTLKKRIVRQLEEER